MKVGDLVKFPTGRSTDTKIGVLLEVFDNPADFTGPRSLKWPPRKVARVLCEGKEWSAWQAHVEVISESR